MAAESMHHERRISALEAPYQHLATKADVEAVRTDLETVRTDLEAVRTGMERLSKELGDKINAQTRWVALLWLTTVIGLVGLILSRPG